MRHVLSCSSSWPLTRSSGLGSLLFLPTAMFAAASFARHRVATYNYIYVHTANDPLMSCMKNACPPFPARFHFSIIPISPQNSCYVFMALVTVIQSSVVASVLQNHGLRTPSGGIYQRNFGPMWQTKYALAVPKHLGLGLDFRPCSKDYFLSGCP